MSTSFLYHVFGARTYDPLKTEYPDGAVYLHLIKKDRFRRCVACHSVGAGQEEPPAAGKRGGAALSVLTRNADPASRPFSLDASHRAGSEGILGQRRMGAPPFTVLVGPWLPSP